MPQIIAAELNKKDNETKLVVSGLKEGATIENVPPDSVLTLVPIGRFVPGRPRSMLVELTSKFAMPHYKTLAVS